MSNTGSTCLRVAIADFDARQLRVEKHYLEAKEPRIECRCYRCGNELLGDLRAGYRCDVVVLGSELEDMTDTDFLMLLRKAEAKPLLLLNTCGSGGKSAVSCLKDDGGYIGWESNLEHLLEELYRIAGRYTLSLEAQCSQMYTEWGVRGNDINRNYLTSALRIACGTEHHLALRKELLQAVGDEYHVSVAAVDSGLRRMVDEQETQGTAGWLEFKRASGFEDKRPSIGKLIYAAKKQLIVRGFAM